jgi:hypothetical protein
MIASLYLTHKFPMKSLCQNVKFDSDLLHKYDQPVPRYTSYPPATELTENFDESLFRGAIAAGNYKKHRYRSIATFLFVKKPVISVVATPLLLS